MNATPSPSKKPPQVWESTIDLRTTKVLLRPLHEADNRALEWHGGPDLRSFYDNQWQSHQKGESMVVVASFNDYPIGQSAIHWWGKPTHPHIPDLQSVRVLDAFQGQGIGTRLLRICEAIVRSHGHHMVSLAVALDNPRARQLYERLGFRVVGTPYDDVWYYDNFAGQSIRVSERVTDLIKDL